MHIAFYGNFDVDYTSESHHAASLEELGHTVARLQEPRVHADEIRDTALAADLFVWVHTHGWDTPGDMSATLRALRAAGIPSVSYHLDRWLGIHRQQDITPGDPYWQLDHFFTVDQLQADYLNLNTPVKGRYLPPGVYGAECYLAEPTEPFDVVFVGSKGYHPEYPMRPKLIEWLSSTYGDRFRHYGGGGLGTVRGAALNQVYANARVAVGDSLILDPEYLGRYWSDRVPETLGRGGVLLHPRVYGLDDFFTDGEHLVTYEHGDFDQLKSLIDLLLEDDPERERIRRAGHEHAKAACAYTVRWQKILDTVRG